MTAEDILDPGEIKNRHSIKDKSGELLQEDPKRRLSIIKNVSNNRYKNILAGKSEVYKKRSLS